MADTRPLTDIDQVTAFVLRAREERALQSAEALPVEHGGAPASPWARAWSSMRGVASYVADSAKDPATYTDLVRGLSLGVQSSALETQAFIHHLREVGASTTEEDLAEPRPGSDPAAILAAPGAPKGKDPLTPKAEVKARQGSTRAEIEGMGTAGQMGAGVAEWAALAVPMAAALQVGGVPSFLAWTIGSVVGGTIGRDPAGGTIGNVVQTMTGPQADPTLNAFRSAIVDTIAVNEDDAYFEKKLKLAVEDLGLGLAAEGMMKLVGGMAGAGRVTLNALRRFRASTDDLPGTAAALRRKAAELEAELVDEDATSIAYLHAGLPLKGTAADPRLLKAKTLRATAEVAEALGAPQQKAE